MQIVIEIPNEYYTDNIVDELDYFLTDYFGGTVCKTTLLPKGHGRLIDADDLCVTTLPELDGLGTEYEPLKYVSYSNLELATTIVEADKEKRDADSD